MRKTNLRNMLLCSALIMSLFTTVSCKEGSNEQGVEAASDANANNSGTTLDDNTGTDGDANARAGEGGNTTASDSVTTTTNNGNTTANGSDLK